MEQDRFEQFLKDKSNKLFHKSDQEKQIGHYLRQI